MRSDDDTFFTVPPAANVVLDYALGDYVEVRGVPQNIKTYTNKTETEWLDRFEINGVTTEAKPMDIRIEDLYKDDGEQTWQIRYLLRSKYAVFIETSDGIIFKKKKYTGSV